METTERKRRICEPPNDGREWMLADDAAALLGIQRKTALALAQKLQWTRFQQGRKQTWILKSQVVWWHDFLALRERWYKRHRYPKSWEPMISVERRENEWKFADYWWTTAQAAEFMGVSTHTIITWARQGKIPLFTTRKMGRGGKYWFSPTSLRNLKESEEWQERHKIWEKGKETLRKGTVAREVYRSQHRARVYKNIPPGWITIWEMAERLDIGYSSAYNLRRGGRILSQQFTGKWDAKWRPWFVHEDSVEEYRTTEHYQKTMKRGKATALAVIGKREALAPESGVCLTKPLPAGYTREELRPGYTREELSFGYTRDNMPQSSLTIEW